MPDHVYKLIELVGSSETSIEAAIEVAVTKAAESVRHLRWVEVQQVRGHIEDGKIAHYQVTLKAAFTLEDEGAQLQS
jgi:flavin-binding protein dodecin